MKRLKKVSVLIIALTLSFCSRGKVTNNSADAELIRMQIINIGLYADTHKWEKLLRIFNKKVLLDYSSFIGGQPTLLNANQIIDNWKRFLPGFDKTMHFIDIKKIQITGKQADCFSSVMAVHYIKNYQSWKVYGYYRHHLIKSENGWKVDKMQFILTFQEGNLDLPKLAIIKMKAINGAS